MHGKVSIWQFFLGRLFIYGAMSFETLIKRVIGAWSPILSIEYLLDGITL